jgi:DNA invertase Pin-like site-specific DNA recombinase
VKVAIYSRFSSELQSENSITDQIALCQRWAERNGHEVVAKYEDRAISGTTRDRPGLLQLLAEVERTKGKDSAASLSNRSRASAATLSARWS